VARHIKSIILNAKYHLVGRCNICNKPTIFLCTDREWLRNNLYCVFCQSRARKRHVAQVIIDLLGVSCVKKIPKGITIYNADIEDSFYKVLHGRDNYICSAFFPYTEPGTEIRKNVYCQDMERLSFADNSFDFVITEDVFEHVRDYKKGFAEVQRVLGPGGYHVFTVPYHFDREAFIRVDTSGPEDVHLFPPQYHGDKIRGKILAYRSYGIDIYDMLAEIGFETKIYVSSFKDRHRGIYDSYVFASRKT
jgi:SAM-dependent methyltransferase